MKRTILTLIILLILSSQTFTQPIAQWRGPDRNGIFPETGLLKSWPESGPELLWALEDLDRGYASVTVTDQIIYLAGRKDKHEFLTALDKDGNRLWRIQYGLGVTKTPPDTRCIPTVQSDKIYLISGSGEVVCVDGGQQKIQWSVPAFEKFQGEFWQWEIAESPLLVDDKVIYTPGGHLTTMVALNKQTGETVWQTETINDTSAFVSPILIQQDDKKIIVNVLINFIIGVDANNGKILWQVKDLDIQPPTFHPWASINK